MKLINWLGRFVLRPPKKKQKFWPRPYGEDFQDMPVDQLHHIYENGSCPYCHSDLYEGPQGGMNVNLYCGNHNCSSAFNVCDPSYGFIPMGQFIGNPPKHFLEMRRLDAEAAD